MTRTFDVSGKLPDDVVAALSALDEHFRGAQVRYVVIGALARDAVTSLVQDGLPERATKDIDLAVRVASMQEFTQIMTGIERVGRHEHRFRVAGLEVDVVPFGGLEADGAVEFRDSVLDVSGLAEAAATSDLVKVTGDLVVDVATVAVLALLKILAWRDRRLWTRKDALDLAHLFSAVGSQPYSDEIWADEAAAELVDFDGSLVGAAWLGRQAGGLAAPATRRGVEEVLSRDAESLADDMAHRLAGSRLSAFARGFSTTRVLDDAGS